MAENTNSQDLFTTKLGIELVTPAYYRKLIDLLADTPRAVLAAVGMPGIGKTAIPKQAARDRGAPYAALHIPTMSIEDFHIPTTATDSKQYYDRRIPRKFQALLSYVEKLKAENGGVFPAGKNPVLAIEELNRASDKAVTRAAFTLLEDRMIGDTHVPEEVQFVVTMNPSGGSMAVNEFEKDPAHRRRLTMVGIAPSHGDFIRYARSLGEDKFHGKVLEHLEAQPLWFYEEKALNAGKKFACPSSWETISQVCLLLEKKNVGLGSTEARAAFAGIIGAAAAEAFGEYVKDSTVVISPSEVLTGYNPDSSVRKRLQKLLVEDRMDKVTALTQGIALKIFSDPKVQPASYSKQLALFMDDLPEEIMLSFFKDIVNQSNLVDQGKAQLTKFNADLLNKPEYAKAIERIQRSKRKIKDEEEKANFGSSN